GEAELDIGVAAVRRVLVGVDEVRPAVEPAAAAVVGETDLGINRAARLGGDRLEVADVRRRRCHRRAEPGRARAVGVELGEDRGRPAPRRGDLVRGEHLPAGADGDVADVLWRARRDALAGAETADLAEPRVRGAVGDRA